MRYFCQKRRQQPDGKGYGKICRRPFDGKIDPGRGRRADGGRFGTAFCRT